MAVHCTGWGLPEGPSVQAGKVNVSGQAGQTTIQQLTDRAIIDWQKFGIAPGELVRFLQPNQMAVLLNRVTGKDPSIIAGQLSANGQIWLVNPNGVFFSNTARIDVAGLLATTLNINNADFLAGRYNFQQDPNRALAAIVNQGEISVTPGGYVVLAAPLVSNQGLIVANLGKVVLASGEKFTLGLDSQGLVTYELPALAGKPGTVLLAPEMVNDVIKGAVQRGGSVDANLITMQDGKLALVQSSGTTIQAGTIRADGGPGQAAGSIVLDSAQETLLRSGSMTSASGQGLNSRGGDVRALSHGITWAQKDSVIEARGGSKGDGGFVEVSGRAVSVGSKVDVSAKDGKAGKFLIDPDFLHIIDGPDTSGTVDGNNPVLQGAFPGSNSTISNGYLETIGAGTIQLEAVNSIIVDDLGVNNLHLQSGVNLTLLAATGNITFANPNTIITGDQATFTFHAGDSIQLGQLQITGAGSVVLNATNDISGVPGLNPGSFNVDAGNLRLTTSPLSPSGNVNLVTSVDNLGARVGNLTLDNNVPLTTIPLSGPRGFGPFTAINNVTIVNHAQLTVLESIVAGNNVSLTTTTGDIRLSITGGQGSNDMITATTVVLRAAHDIVADYFFGEGFGSGNIAATNVALSAQNLIDPFELLSYSPTNLSIFAGNGSYAYSGSKDITVANIDNINGIRAVQGNVTLDSPGNLILAAPVVANDTACLGARGGNITQVGGGLSVQASLVALSANGTVGTQANPIQIDASVVAAISNGDGIFVRDGVVANTFGNLTIGNVDCPGSTFIPASNTAGATIGGADPSVGNIDIGTVGCLTVANVVTGGNIALNATGEIELPGPGSLTPIVANTTASLVAGGNIRGGGNAVPDISTTNLALTAGNSVGSVQPLLINMTGGLAGQSGGDVLLNSIGGNLTLANVTTNATTLSGFNTSGSFILNNTAPLAAVIINTEIRSTQSVGLNTTGEILLNNANNVPSITAATVCLNTPGNIVGGNHAATVDIKADAVAFNGTTVSGMLITPNTANNILVSGLTNGAFQVNVTGNATIDNVCGLVGLQSLGGNAANLTATGSLSVNSTVNATDVSLNATTGNISVPTTVGSITGNSTVTLNADAGNISFTGPNTAVTSNATAVVNANLNIDGGDVGGAVDIVANNVTLTSVGGALGNSNRIKVGANNLATVNILATAPGNISLFSTNNTDATVNTTGGNLDLSVAGNLSPLAPIGANATACINVSGTLINPGGLVVQTNQLALRVGNISAAPLVVDVGTLAVQADSGSVVINDGTATDLYPHLTIANLTCGGSINGINATGVINVTTTGNLTVTAQVNTPLNAGLQAANNITLLGTNRSVVAGNVLIVGQSVDGAGLATTDIQADQLAISATGQIGGGTTVASTANILAATGSNVRLRNVGDLNVGSVSKINGIQSGSNIVLDNTGELTVTQPVNAPNNVSINATGNVTLFNTVNATNTTVVRAGGNITGLASTPEDLTATNVGLSAGGAINVTASATNVALQAGAGNISFIGSTAFTVANVDNINGVNAQAGNVLLQANTGDLTIGAPVLANTTACILALGGSILDPGGQNIVAQDVGLFATGTIGTFAAPLLTDTLNLAANSGTGGVFLADGFVTDTNPNLVISTITCGPLVIDGVNATAGNVAIQSEGRLTVVNAIRSNDVALAAFNDIDLPGPVTSPAISATGQVDLNALGNISGGGHGTPDVVATNLSAFAGGSLGQPTPLVTAINGQIAGLAGNIVLSNTGNITVNNVSGFNGLASVGVLNLTNTGNVTVNTTLQSNLDMAINVTGELLLTNADNQPSINSGGNVCLVATGNILGGNHALLVDIVADAVAFNANTVAGVALAPGFANNVTISGLTTGNFDASVVGNVTVGNVCAINGITAQGGLASVNASGNIDGGAGTIHVVANNVSLQSTAAIGNGNRLGVQAFDQPIVNVSALATGNINLLSNNSTTASAINSTGGDLNLTVNGNLTTVAPLGALGTASVNVTGDLINPGGGLDARANSLAVRAGNLTGPALDVDVANLAVQSGGSAVINDGALSNTHDGLTIGTVSGITGINASGAINATSQGSTNISAPVTTPNNVALNATQNLLFTNGGSVNAANVLLLGQNVDGAGQATSDVVANQLAVNASGQIGGATALKTTANVLALSGSNVRLSNTGNASVGSVSGLNGIQSGGNVILVNSGELTVNQPINAPSNVSINGSGNVTLQNTVNSTNTTVIRAGGDIVGANPVDITSANVGLSAGGALRVNASATNVALIAGAGNISYVSPTGFTVANVDNLNGVNAQTGNVLLVATTGDLTLAAPVVANTTACLLAQGGSIFDGGNGLDVRAQDLALLATGTIGTTAAPLRIDAQNLAARGGTGIHIIDGVLSNTNPNLTISTLTCTVGGGPAIVIDGANASAGNVDIQTTGRLAVVNAVRGNDVNLSATGDIILPGPFTAPAVNATGTVGLTALGNITGGNNGVFDVVGANLAVNAGGQVSALQTSISGQVAGNATGNVVLRNTGNMTIGNVSGLTGLTSAAAVNLTNTGNLTVNTTVRGAQDVALNSTGDIRLQNANLLPSVVAGGNACLVAAGNVLGGNHANGVDIKADGVAFNATSVANVAIASNLANNVTLSGLTTGGFDVSIVGNVAVGNVCAINGVTAQGNSASINASGNIDGAAGTIHVVANNITLQSGGAIGSTGRPGLQSFNQPTVNVSAVAPGNINLLSNNSTTAGVNSTGGDLNLTVNGNLTTTSPLGALGTATLNVTGNLTNPGAGLDLRANSLAVRAGSFTGAPLEVDVTNLAVQSGGAVALNDGGLSNTHDGLTIGTVSGITGINASGAINVTSQGGTNISAPVNTPTNVALNATQNVLFTNGGSVNAANVLLLGQNVDGAGQATSDVVANQLAVNASGQIGASTPLSTTANVLALRGGNITLNNQGNATIGTVSGIAGVQAGSNVTLRNNGNLVVNQTINTSNNVSLNVTGNVFLNSTTGSVNVSNTTVIRATGNISGAPAAPQDLTSGNIGLAAGGSLLNVKGNAQNLALQAGVGNLSYSSPTGFTVANVDGINGINASTGNVLLQANNNIRLAAPVFANNTATIITGGNLDGSGSPAQVDVRADFVTLNSTAGSIGNASQVQAQALTAANLTLQANASGLINLAANGNTRAAANSSNGAVSLNVNGNLTVANSVAARTNAFVNTTGSMSGNGLPAGSDVTGANVALVAGGSLGSAAQPLRTSANIVAGRSGADANLISLGNTTVGAVSGVNGLNATGAITFTAQGALNVVSPVVGNTVTLNGSGPLNLLSAAAPSLQSTGLANVSAPSIDGSAGNNSDIQAPLVALRSSGTIGGVNPVKIANTTVAASAGNNLFLTGLGNVSVGNATGMTGLNGGNVVYSHQGSLTLDVAPINATNELSLVTSGNLNLVGPSTGPSLVATTAVLNVSGNLTGGSDDAKVDIRATSLLLLVTGDVGASITVSPREQLNAVIPVPLKIQVDNLAGRVGHNVTIDEFNGLNITTVNGTVGLRAGTSVAGDGNVTITVRQGDLVLQANLGAPNDTMCIAIPNGSFTGNPNNPVTAGQAAIVTQGGVNVSTDVTFLAVRSNQGQVTVTELDGTSNDGLTIASVCGVLGVNGTFVNVTTIKGDLSLAGPGMGDGPAVRASIGAQLNALDGSILGPNRDCIYDVISPTVNFIAKGTVGTGGMPLWLPDGTGVTTNAPSFFGVCEDLVIAPATPLSPTVLILLANSDPLQVISSASASSSSLVTQQVVAESEYPAPSFFIRKRSKALIRVEASR